MAFDAFDGRLPEERAERFVVEGEEVAELGDEECFVGMEDRFAGGLGEFVPGANFQTDITTVNAITDGAAEFYGDGAFVFDGEIGNAASSIDSVWCYNGGGGAGYDAPSAFATVVDGRGIGRELKGGEDFGEEEPCAEAAMDLHGAFAIPAETGDRGEIAFQNGPSIDVVTLGSALGGECRIEGAELFPHQVVVVLIPCVAGNFPIGWVFDRAWVVVQS